jgi:hypothetical protein
MSEYEGTEFPPLWPPGFHPITIAEIWARCVGDFDLSTNRKGLMEAFLIVADYLATVGVTCEIWLDGSFTTTQN